mmetsp:Transcript_121752/g.191078  ORF Transcript_121752/g.191078 Transcript_121752/m.191078 type:complete len:732 (+) Transcript_121752:115-2310(+)
MLLNPVAQTRVRLRSPKQVSPRCWTTATSTLVGSCPSLSGGGAPVHVPKRVVAPRRVSGASLDLAASSTPDGCGVASPLPPPPVAPPVPVLTMTSCGTAVSNSSHTLSSVYAPPAESRASPDVIGLRSSMASATMSGGGVSVASAAETQLPVFGASIQIRAASDSEGHSHHAGWCTSTNVVQTRVLPDSHGGRALPSAVVGPSGLYSRGGSFSVAVSQEPATKGAAATIAANGFGSFSGPVGSAPVQGSFVAPPGTALPRSAPSYCIAPGAGDDPLLRSGGCLELRRSGGGCLGSRVQRVQSIPGVGSALPSSSSNTCAMSSSAPRPYQERSTSPSWQARISPPIGTVQKVSSSPPLSTIPTPLFSAWPFAASSSKSPQRLISPKPLKASGYPNGNITPLAPEDKGLHSHDGGESEATATPPEPVISAEDRCSFRWQWMSVQLLNRLAYREQLKANVLACREDVKVNPNIGNEPRREETSARRGRQTSSVAVPGASGAARSLMGAMHRYMSPTQSSAGAAQTHNSPSSNSRARGDCEGEVLTMRASPPRARVRRGVSGGRDIAQNQHDRTSSPVSAVVGYRSPSNANESIGITSTTTVSSNDHPLTTDAASRLRDLATQIGGIVKCRQRHNSGNEWSQDLLLGVVGALESAAGGNYHSSGAVKNSSVHPVQTTDVAVVAATAAIVSGRPRGSEKTQECAARSPPRRSGKSNSPPRGRTRRGIVRSAPRTTA